MFSPSFYATLAVAIDLCATACYIRDVWRGHIKPHSFSWFIWTLLMFIGAAVSLSEGAIAGGATLLASGFENAIIFAMSLKIGDQRKSREDWISFAGTLAAIPLWLLTKDPLSAAILITLIDASSFRFTYRKVWDHPEEEYAGVFLVFVVTGLLRLASMQPLTLTSALYPAALLLLNLSLSLFIFARRFCLRRKEKTYVA